MNVEYIRHWDGVYENGDPPQTDVEYHGWYIVTETVGGEFIDATGAYATREIARQVMYEIAENEYGPFRT